MSSNIASLRKDIMDMKAVHAKEVSELEAKHAAELAKLEAFVVAALKETEDSVAALRSELSANIGAPPTEKPTMAFKICSYESLSNGEHKISDFNGFVGANYKFAMPLPSCDDEQEAVATLTGLPRQDGKLISKDVAQKLVLFKKKVGALKGKLIAVLACGKEGKKHGGEIRRIVGDYTYDATTLPGGGKCYHRFATVHERWMTPNEFEKAMEQLGNTPNSKYRLQWPIKI